MSAKLVVAVLALSDASKRRTPICARRVVLSAFVGLAATAFACIYSAYRIEQNESSFDALQHSQVMATGKQLMSGIQRQLETSVSSTKALSALIPLDEGQKLLEPLGPEIAVLKEAASNLATLPFDVDGDVTSEQQAAYDDAKEAKAAAASQVIQNASKFKFNSVADSLISTYRGISNLQLAPGGIVSAIHPIEGNEGAVGHDLFFDQSRRAGAIAAIDRGGIVFIGPITLIQNGKRAIIARNPTFINTPDYVGPFSDSPKWWGFTTMLCVLDDLWEATPLAGETLDVSYILYAKSSTGIKFLKASDDVPGSDVEESEASPWYTFAMEKKPVIVDFSMGDLNVHWEMLLWPVEGWQKHSDSFILQVGLCTFLTLCSSISLYSVLVRESVMEQVAGILKGLHQAGLLSQSNAEEPIPEGFDGDQWWTV